MTKVISTNNIIFSIYLDITPQIIDSIFCPILNAYIPSSFITFNKSTSMVTFTSLNTSPYNESTIIFIIKGTISLGNNFINMYMCKL